MRYMNALVPGSAAMLSAGMDKKETADVYRRMRGEPVKGGDKLVMVLVTPEKVVSAKKIVSRVCRAVEMTSAFWGDIFCLYSSSLPQVPRWYTR